MPDDRRLTGSTSEHEIGSARSDAGLHSSSWQIDFKAIARKDARRAVGPSSRVFGSFMATNTAVGIADFPPRSSAISAQTFPGGNGERERWQCVGAPLGARLHVFVKGKQPAVPQVSAEGDSAGGASRWRCGTGAPIGARWLRTPGRWRIGLMILPRNKRCRKLRLGIVRTIAVTVAHAPRQATPRHGSLFNRV
jgi:hypothetical protein